MTERPPLRVVEGAPDDDSDTNAELVSVLLTLLAQAETGEITALAYATDDAEGIVWGDWSEREAGGAVWALARLLDAAVEEE